MTRWSRSLTLLAAAATLVGCQSAATMPFVIPTAASDCGPDAITADVDGDGNAADLIGHDMVDGVATVRVCLAGGGAGQVRGMGMAEFLQVIDVTAGGQAAIVYGATTVAALAAQVAVWVDGDLMVVELDDGSPLELRAGGDGTFDQGRDRWSTYDGWGCADLDDDGQLELVTMRAEQSAEGYEVTVISYTLEGASVRVATETVTTVDDSANPLADLGIPNCTAVE